METRGKYRPAKMITEKHQKKLAMFDREPGQTDEEDLADDY